MKITKRKFLQERATLNAPPLPPYDALNKAVLNQLLDPQQGMPFAMRAVIRTQLGMSAETNAPAAATIFTNAPPAAATNSVAK